MTLNLLENVQVYLLSQALARYCMMQFVESWNLFLELIVYKKNLMLKILKIKFYLMEYHNTFQKKE